MLEVLQQSILPKDALVTVIMGATAPHLQSVQQQAQILPYKTEIKVNVSNMANADLAIGAAGATTWERLPSIQIVIAENQKQIAENLSSINAIKYIKKVDDVIILIETTPTWMQNIGQTASQVCDGAGTQKVIDQLVQLRQS
ncbi:MAG: UDP-2,4-diacetamido-2,4,6-trideoxy-beta-L-altropyranose hydrolase [Colwellia sp.]